MILKTTTIRQIEKKDLPDFIQKLIEAGVPIDYEELLREGEYTHECDEGYTNARTKHELILG